MTLQLREWGRLVPVDFLVSLGFNGVWANGISAKPRHLMRRSTVRLMRRLRRKTQRGFRGYPVGTIAFYGPDDCRATKLVVSIIESEGAEPSEMQKWYAEDSDVRSNHEILAEAVAFLDRHGVASVAMPDRIIGCPHEEGIDYEGPTCPECPFWAHRDRWTGEIIH